MTQKELTQLAADELGYDVELIDFVIKNFYKTLRYYLSRPWLCRSGIKVITFIKFHHKYWKYDKERQRLEGIIETLSDKKINKLNYIKQILRWRKTSKPKK